MDNLIVPIIKIVLGSYMLYRTKIAANILRKAKSAIFSYALDMIESDGDKGLREYFEEMMVPYYTLTFFHIFSFRGISGIKKEYRDLLIPYFE